MNIIVYMYLLGFIWRSFDKMPFKFGKNWRTNVDLQQKKEILFNNNEKGSQIRRNEDKKHEQVFFWKNWTNIP